MNSRISRPRTCIIRIEGGFVVCGYSPNAQQGAITTAQVDAFLTFYRDNNENATFSSVAKLRNSLNPETFNYKREMKSPFGMHLVTYDSSFSSRLPLQSGYSLEEIEHH